MVRIPPPDIHLTAYASGGLAQLYEKINKSVQEEDEEDIPGKFWPTDLVVYSTGYLVYVLCNSFTYKLNA